MNDCCASFDKACLYELKPSRRLRGWWIAVHVLVGLALLMINPGAALAGAPLLLIHARRRNPVHGTLLVVSDGPRFALPAEGRFDLRLSASSRCGRFWMELAFCDRPRSRLLVLRDQLEAPDWRRLRIWLEATAADPGRAATGRQ